MADINCFNHTTKYPMKSLSTILWLIIFLSPFASNSQEIEWQNRIGGNLEDYLEVTILTSDGGFLLGGSSKSGLSGDKTEYMVGGYDYWILKYDSAGVIQWQNTIGGFADDKLLDVIQTSDGGYLLGGYSNSDIGGDKTENSLGEDDYWVVKTDAAGVIQWQNTIGGSADDEMSSVIQTADGGYLLGGDSESGISFDKTENSIGLNDYWIVKIGSNGTVLWQNTVGGSSVEVFDELVQAQDGGYLLGGYSYSDSSGDKSENSLGSYDFWVVKIDVNGLIQWENTIGGNSQDLLISVINGEDGKYFLGGLSQSDISGDKTEAPVYPNSPDYWIMEIDSVGIIQWQSTIGSIGATEVFTAAARCNDGGYLIGGYSNGGLNADKTEAGYNNGDDFWIIKTDSIGNIQWQNTIMAELWDRLGTIMVTNDGKYLVGGTTGSLQSGDLIENLIGGCDFWIMKITDQYNVIQGEAFMDWNSNQVHEAGEPSLKNHKIRESNSNRFAFTQINGSYNLVVVDTGNFEVTPDFSMANFNHFPLVYSGNFASAYEIDSLNNFSFQPTTVFNDLCVTITPTGWFRSGFNAGYNILYYNQGTTTLTPTIIFYPDSDITFLSASVPPANVTPDSIIFTSGSLQPFQSGQISITININQGLTLGTIINTGARVLPDSADANPGCNLSYWDLLTVGPYDPNDIKVNRSFIYENELLSPPDLEYVIRFQNTGTDTAFVVKLLNPIDTTRLDLSTIEIVNSSHDMEARFIPHERNMEFLFNNILLPDSNINEPQSHGFAHYRIKPKSNLLAGDSIQNKAAIYFDFNFPVITNKAVTHILSPNGISATDSEPMTFNVYPNPVKEELQIQLNFKKSTVETIELFNVYGQKVLGIYSGTISPGLWERKFDLSTLRSGVYFLKINNGSTASRKIIKL